MGIPGAFKNYVARIEAIPIKYFLIATSHFLGRNRLYLEKKCPHTARVLTLFRRIFFSGPVKLHQKLEKPVKRLSW